MNFLQDTIVARATPPGNGGVGIVRLSGSGAVDLVERFFRPVTGGSLSAVPPRYMVHGTITSDGDIVDRCLVVRFEGPASFTGEDVVELHLHGNQVIIDQVLQLSVACGARPATAGEFSRRAFINGKMDLVQVEALGDLIAAESEQALYISQRQFHGEFRRKLEAFRGSLVTTLAALELELDFVEDGYHFASDDELQSLLRDLGDFCDGLLSSYHLGNRLRKGPRVLLLGKPNAGKSSLFNAFLGYSRSLVSAQAGTTRDYIEELIHYRGIAFHLIDTAGLRETVDAIEAEGVGYARDLIALSDHIFYLIDSSDTSSIEDELAAVDTLCRSHPQSWIVPIFTKVDIADGASDHLG
ncbi:MAG: tRNA uridine-5-carboxymethylaminomethyl(34) synthesis GTPase MnmE, partial [Bacteroidota bacterium]